MSANVYNQQVSHSIPCNIPSKQAQSSTVQGVFYFSCAAKVVAVLRFAKESVCHRRSYGIYTLVKRRLVVQESWLFPPGPLKKQYCTRRQAVGFE